MTDTAPQDHDPEFEFLIVGSGAGGCAAAYKLALAGKRVLLLEKGQALPDDGSTLDPVQVIGGRFNSKEPWFDARAGRRFAPEEHFNIGGKTRWYGAALLRFSRAEFSAEPTCGLLSWPLTFDEIEPYYREAEALLQVRIFNDEPDLLRMRPALAAAGWMGEPLQLGLSADIALHPIEETHFDGYAVPNGLKADAPDRFLKHVMGVSKLKLLAGIEVVSLLPDAVNPRRVIGVRCADGREFYAGTVLLAAGAMHSPRLLQRFIGDAGIAAQLPGCGLVGRYYKRHILTAVIGFGWRTKGDRVCKTSAFVHKQFPHSSMQPLGGWADRETVRSLMPSWLPKWLTELFALRAYGFFLQTEDGSHPDNRVFDTSGSATDRLPTLDYDLKRMPQLAAEHRSMVRSFMLATARAGLIPFKQSIPLQGTAHVAGTLVSGTDPATSVVDGDGKVHGLVNLLVVDGSVLPRLSRMNPALTIYAFALRAATLLLR